MMEKEGLKNSYTLYFKGVNELEQKILFPVITLNLKDMDKFTANYEDSISMFNCLPKSIKNYISENLSYNIDLEDKKSMKNRFVIKNDATNENVNILFFKDSNVVYITQKELKEKILKIIFSYKELQLILRNKENDALKLRYEFFLDLYNKYVKDKKLSTMIDTYDIKERYPKMGEDKLLISSIITDKANILVLVTKIGQKSVDKRNLTIEYRKIYKKLFDDEFLDEELIKKRFNKDLDVVEMKKNILKNYKVFKKIYNV